MLVKREPIFFCFCGPGASGKSTLARALIEKVGELKLSLSTTTREPRGQEVDGHEYYFVSETEFTERVKKGEFLEYATFNGKQYGTELRNLREATTKGFDLLLDIDYQGAEQLKVRYPSQTVTVFVFPPSFPILKERFLARGTETPDKIAKRLEIARAEVTRLSAPGFSDYLLVNDTLPEAIKDALAIVRAERQRISRVPEESLRTLLA